MSKTSKCNKDEWRKNIMRDIKRCARDYVGDELLVLSVIAKRLRAGALTYGPLQLDRDRRDFRHEAFEEACDAAIYLACKLSEASHVR